MSAKLIVIDGADNSGKATQTALLVERLKNDGVKVGTMDFPRYTQNTFGKLIKESLMGQHGDFLEKDPRVASVLYAADRFEAKKELQILLEENDVVVLDRYVSANMLHQGAKIKDETERKEFLLWLEHVEYEIFEIPKPDHTIMLFVSQAHRRKVLAEMVKNGKKTPDLAELDEVHQNRVAECALWLSSMRPNWSTIQCSQDDHLRTIESIHEEIVTHVKLLLS
jgi:dTMP kinase